MSVRPEVQATITNIGRGGRYVVIHTITTELGSFATYTEAEQVAAVVTGKPRD